MFNYQGDASVLSAAFVVSAVLPPEHAPRDRTMAPARTRDMIFDVFFIMLSPLLTQILLPFMDVSYHTTKKFRRQFYCFKFLWF